jgi:L-amino acid N-acyltransferase YncA
MNNVVKRVLITLGGEDSRGLTPIILSKLVKLYPNMKFDVVHKDIRNLKILFKGFDNINYHTNLDAQQFRDLMLEVDFCITAAGQTVYELITTNTPFIGLITEENQRFHVAQIERKFPDVKWLELVEITLIEKIINLDRLNISQINNFANSINTKSTKNIISELIINTQDFLQFTLHPLVVEDADSILELSNESEVRLNSFNQEKINSLTHLGWISRALKKDDLEVFTLKSDKAILVSYVKFEKKERHVFIGIAVSEEFRGKKLSSYLIFTAIKEYLKAHHDREILAEIKSTNVKSLKAFKKIGFESFKINSEVVTLIY